MSYGRIGQLLPALTLALAAAAASAGTINGINGGMPNRISMNVTVPKQTQGATFGEKVQSGLQAAGGALANGANVRIECGAAACAIALPDGSGYLVDLQSLQIGALDPAQGMSVRNGTAGAALLGGALPGGAIVSAAVSSVSALAGGSGGGAAAASYAATGRAAAPAPLAQNVREGGDIDVVEPLTAGDYVLDLQVVRAAPPVARSVKRGADAASAPARIRMRLVILAADGALRVRRESAGNSVSVEDAAK